MTTTDWTPIPTWEGAYEAHPDGRIRSMDRTIRVSRWVQQKPGRVLRPSLAGRYQAVDLTHEGRKERRYVHQLIAEVFIGPRAEGLVVCHEDGDVLNNQASNLRYDTRSGNNRDMARHGTHRLAARTHCDKGHAFTPENTRIRPSGARLCIQCARTRGAAWMRRHRATQKGQEA